jgi:hypothetical protein
MPSLGNLSSQISIKSFHWSAAATGDADVDTTTFAQQIYGFHKVLRLDLQRKKKKRKRM